MKKLVSVAAVGLLVGALTLSAFGFGLLGSASADTGDSDYSGTLEFSTSPDARAASELYDAGPSFVQCEQVVTNVSCEAIDVSTVLNRVERGEIVYARTIYKGITDDVVDRGVPLFRRDELVCVDASKASGCQAAGTATPTIIRGESSYVTYLRLETRTLHGKTVYFRAAGEIPLKWAD